MEDRSGRRETDVDLLLLTEKIKEVAGDTHEIKALARATNGRITELERWRIATTAVQDERARSVAHMASVEAQRVSQREHAQDRRGANQISTRQFWVGIAAVMAAAVGPNLHF